MHRIVGIDVPTKTGRDYARWASPASPAGIVAERARRKRGRSLHFLARACPSKKCRRLTSCEGVREVLSRACPSKTDRASEQESERGREVLSRACPSKTDRPNERTPAERTEPLCQPGLLGLPSVHNREVPRGLAFALAGMRFAFNGTSIDRLVKLYLIAYNRLYGNLVAIIKM